MKTTAPYYLRHRPSGASIRGARRVTRLSVRPSGWLLLGGLWLLSPALACAQERCYPGSPVKILRELMGGVDSEEGYVSAVTGYVRASCLPGQILKLVSPGGRGDRTDRLNQQLAEGLCESQTIDREPITMAAERAVIVHCVIAGPPEAR